MACANRSNLQIHGAGFVSEASCVSAPACPTSLTTRATSTTSLKSAAERPIALCSPEHDNLKSTSHLSGIDVADSIAHEPAPKARHASAATKPVVDWDDLTDRENLLVHRIWLPTILLLGSAALNETSHLTSDDSWSLSADASPR